jgi:hypothetical protein
VTVEELQEKVRRWDQQSTGRAADAHYSTILRQIEYHAEHEWRVYMPTEHSDFSSAYLERLAAWIGNLHDEADQQLLLEYATHISFFSHGDFAALYRAALSREIAPWVARQIGVNLQNGGAAFDALLRKAMHRSTWYCPVTDSMDINEFHKVNHLTGIGHRPPFAFLQFFAERAATPDPALVQNVSAYMQNPGVNSGRVRPALERIVLLEDIVGSSNQCIDAVKWATTFGKPVLFVPLLLCPNGLDPLRSAEAQSNGLLTVRPIIQLGRQDLLGPERQDTRGWPISEDLEALVARHAPRLPAGMSPFGYKDTGCSIATFANTPDNTLPIVHVHRASQQPPWQPLFPRVLRD